MGRIQRKKKKHFFVSKICKSSCILAKNMAAKNHNCIFMNSGVFVDFAHLCSFLTFGGQFTSFRMAHKNKFHVK
jgi:hypothetical protein